MEDKKDLFGGGFFDEHTGQAQQGWGQDGEQSQRRMSERTKKDWTRIQAEVEESNAAFAAAMDAGLPASGARAWVSRSVSEAVPASSAVMALPIGSLSAARPVTSFSNRSTKGRGS